MFKAGKRNGQNECKWSNGIKYAGTFNHGHIVAGEYSYPDGSKLKLAWFVEKKGCLVWNPAPQVDEEVIWDGECLNGYAEGKGTLKFSTKDMEQSYIGEMSKGKQQGEGTFQWLKHDKACDDEDNIYYCYKSFVGDFNDNKRVKGTYTLINGTKISFKNTNERMSWVRDQNQCLVWNEGNPLLEKTIWTGQCEDGYASGKGTVTMIRSEPKKNKISAKVECIGQLKQGKLDGQNDCKWSNGISYSGLLKEDLFHGKGTFKWKDGSIYTGLWAENMRNGHGEMDWGNGESYSGMWKDNQQHGTGTYQWLKHDKPCSQTNRFYCYKKFVGNFINDKFGNGIFTRLDGDKVKQNLDIALTEIELIDQGKGIWAKDQNGCQVWSGSDLAVETVMWNGSCIDDFVSGEGIIKMVWKEEKVNKGEKQKPNQQVICTGSMKKGKLNGYSECEWQDGTVYKGTWKDVHPVAGEYIFKSGSKQAVKWFEEKNGCLVWNEAPQADEEVSWDGACFQGYAQGHGTLEFFSSDVKQSYTGEMTKGKPNGKGSYHWLKHDKPCDEEKSLYSCYKRFVGNFSHGSRGKGIYTLISGRKIVSNKSAMDDAITSLNRSSKRYFEATLLMIQQQQQLDLIFQSMEDERRRMEIYNKSLFGD
jgi:hypothetical protein